MTDFVIIQSGSQVKAQSEAAAIVIPIGDGAKDFQMTNHVLDQNYALHQLTVRTSLVFVKRFALRLLEQSLRIGVDFLHTLIIGIAQQTNVCRNRQRALFEHRKIVRFLVSLCHANNFASRLINHDLRFYRMPLFLTRIILLLFFYGRLIGVFVTSTMTNTRQFSLSHSTFLPDNFKSQQFLSRFSIFSIMRETVASGNYQRLARWSCIGYLRQYSNVSNTWSSTGNLHGLPDFFCTWRSSSRIDPQILTKVSSLTLQYRLKSAAKAIQLFKNHQIIDERNRSYCQIIYARDLKE